jgi:hypothetical protein
VKGVNSAFNLEDGMDVRYKMSANVAICSSVSQYNGGDIFYKGKEGFNLDVDSQNATVEVNQLYACNSVFGINISLAKHWPSALHLPCLAIYGIVS